MKTAVCILAATPTGIVAVSRRNDTTQWGFPGGKVDEGESAETALLREVGEELGLADIDRARLIPLFSGVCRGKGPDDTFWVTTYYLLGHIDIAALVPEVGLEIRAMTERELTDASSSPFAAYNVQVFKALSAFRF